MTTRDSERPTTSPICVCVCVCVGVGGCRVTVCVCEKSRICIILGKCVRVYTHRFIIIAVASTIKNIYTEREKERENDIK